MTEEDWKEAKARVWQMFKAAQRRDNVEASVALSHEMDCKCPLCQRVRARHEKANPRRRVRAGAAGREARSNRL